MHKRESMGETKQSCKFRDRCPMFPVFNSKQVLAVYKALYCNGRFERCQRFQSAAQGLMPPADLLPDGDRMPG